MTSLRKQRTRVQRMQQAMCRRRRDTAHQTELGDRMPAVGREFGSPDFERLMAEDHRLAQGVFDPALREGAEAFGHRSLRAKR
jgi:hypothetical protein